MSPRRLLASILLAVLAAPLLASTQAEASNESVQPAVQAMLTPNDRIIVTPGTSSSHPVIASTGYDIKQAGAADALTTSAAATLFGNSNGGGFGFNTVRIPLLARQAHPSNGTIDTALYAPYVAAVKRIPSYQSRTVFSSLALVDNSEFPGWVKTGSPAQVNALLYGQLVFQYLRYLHRSAGVTVDVMGVDNESTFNDGGITPQKYENIVIEAKSRIDDWNATHSGSDDVPKPTFIGPDNYSPDPQWLDGIGAVGAWGQLGTVGTHYYSKNRDKLNDLNLMSSKASNNGKPFWQTEFHWNERDCTDGNDPACDLWLEWNTSTRGVWAAMDNFSANVSGFTWWAFNAKCPASPGPYCNNSPRASLHTAIAKSTERRQSLNAPQDQDGTSVGADQFSTRAFRFGGVVHVWIVNDTATDYLGASAKGIEVANFNVTSGYNQATYEVFERTGSGDVTYSGGLAGTPDPVNNMIKVDVPSKSIVIVKLPAVA